MSDQPDASIPVRVTPVSASDLHQTAAAPAAPVTPEAPPAVTTVPVTVSAPEPTTPAAPIVTVPEATVEAKPEVADDKPVEPVVTETPAEAVRATTPLTQDEVKAALATGPTPPEPADALVVPAVVATAAPLPTEPSTPVAKSHRGTMWAIVVAAVVIVLALGLVYWNHTRPAKTTATSLSPNNTAAPLSTTDTESQAASIDQSMSGLDTGISNVNTGLSDQQGDLSE